MPQKEIRLTHLSKPQALIYGPLFALVSAFVLEVLARLSRPVGTPEAVLILATVYAGYRAGAVSGLLGALVADLYLFYAFLSPYHPELSDSDAVWRLTLALIILPGSAAVIGHLRDRFEVLLEREREARTLAEAERERTGRILESMTDGFVAFDRDWRITSINRIAERLLGRPRDELVGTDARALLPDPQTNVFLQSYQRALESNGPVVFEAQSHLVDTWFEVHAYPSSEGLSVFFRDVTERRKHEEKLQSMSLRDDLTGLYNRRGFLTLAEQQCRVAERSQRGFLLVFVDLDNLKQINDSLGHGAGDDALCNVASVLRHTFRESDIVARIGGDEFAALALDTQAEAADVLLQRLDTGIAEHNAGDLPFELSLSCGTASFRPTAPCSVEDLLREADRKMYERKRQKQRM